MLHISTDNKWHDFRYRNEVPDKVLASQFDHLSDAVDGFLKYRGHWYHLSDFMASSIGFPNWDAYHPDSFYSGVFIKVSTDGEQYRIGTYIT